MNSDLVSKVFQLMQSHDFTLKKEAFITICNLINTTNNTRFKLHVVQLYDFKIISLFIEIMNCQQGMLLIEVLQALDNVLSLDEEISLLGPDSIS